WLWGVRKRRAQVHRRRRHRTGNGFDVSRWSLLALLRRGRGSLLHRRFVRRLFGFSRRLVQSRSTRGLQRLDPGEAIRITALKVFGKTALNDLTFSVVEIAQIGHAFESIYHALIKTGTSRERPAAGAQLDIGDRKAILVALLADVASEGLGRPVRGG